MFKNFQITKIFYGNLLIYFSLECDILASGTVQDSAELLEPAIKSQFMQT